MTQELVPTGGMGEVTHNLTPPDKIIEQAQAIAIKLTDIVKKTGSSQKIGKKEHLKIEAWVTVGQFYNCTARVKDTEHVEFGDVTGFRARAQLTHDATGMVLSEAEAYCMRDEDRWNTRTKYKWVDDQPIPDGQETVPMFQLASMAQTRAMAKVLAAKFRWVVVLAGYATTPAEEMTGTESHDSSDSHQQPAKQANKEQGVKKLAYGTHKGKPITDESIPAQYLGWLIKSTRENLGKGKRKSYEAQDQADIKAYEAELERRKGLKDTKETPKTAPTDKETAPQTSEQAPPAQQTEQHGMDEDAWVDLCLLWYENNNEQYNQACHDFKTKDATKLSAEDRAKFQAAMKDLIGKAKA